MQGGVLMDNVREKIREQNRNRSRKILLGVIVLVIVAITSIMIEKNISTSVVDVTIEKSSISDAKAEFIPIKQLGTSIIAVKLTDGSYRLAFDDCKGCYVQFGKHARFKNNAENTGIICKNCKSEVAYEDIGYDFGDVVIPYPIYESEIIVNEDNFVLSKDYLEKHKQIFEELRQGKGMSQNTENPAD